MKRWRKCVYKPGLVAAPADSGSLRERLVRWFGGGADSNRGYAQLPSHYDKSDVLCDDCL